MSRGLGKTILFVKEHFLWLLALVALILVGVFDKEEKKERKEEEKFGCIAYDKLEAEMEKAEMKRIEQELEKLKEVI
jgi:hypothetical protein